MLNADSMLKQNPQIKVRLVISNESSDDCPQVPTSSSPQSKMDEPIEFTYNDTDTYSNEISELYSYSEESDFFANRNAFEESMEDCGLPLTWKHMVPEQQSKCISHLMNSLDVSNRAVRIKSCRAITYLIQGNFGECLTLEEQAINSKANVYLLYKQGVFPAFVQQLLIEISRCSKLPLRQPPPVQLQSASTAEIFHESAELRLILSVLCSITETMYHAKDSNDNEILQQRQQFINELQYPLLIVTLFQMLNGFCNGQCAFYPVRKITILLRKIILITLGGTEDLKSMKIKRREQCNLSPIPDDTMEVTKNMCPCSPPIMEEGQARARTNLSGGAIANRRKVLKQTAFDDAVYAYAKECLLNRLVEINQPDDQTEETPSENQSENGGETQQLTGDGENLPVSDEAATIEPESPASDENNPVFKSSSNARLSEDIKGEDASDNVMQDEQTSSSVDTSDELVSDKSESQDIEPLKLSINTTKISDLPSPSSGRSETNCYKGLPWAPKVRKADLIAHMTYLRQKFLGYSLSDETETTFGLPDPVIEGINVLKKHLYVSLSDVQLDREKEIQRYPLTCGELNPNFRDEAAEKLYVAILPHLPQYMISLLKILLAASTVPKSKSDRVESINIMAEVNTDVDSQSLTSSMRVAADIERHREIIVKSISAILLLLLKHFKLNHIYQFEYASQQLMFANCIPLILKFLSVDVHAHIISSKSNISALEFPACVMGEQCGLPAEAIDLASYQQYSWRNMFSCINLVRILNKITKWKHSRIMMLVVFKSSQTLLRALAVKQPVFQLYVLKLLKAQLKFLGRQWKKTNMKLMSPIYQRVRHRLTDDWAYSNDNEARPWDFQAEEFTLQTNINKFHQRRYQDILTSASRRSSSVFSPSDKNRPLDDYVDEDYDFDINDLVQCSPKFAHNYSRWLESEVFQRNIDWDKLLD